MGLYRPMRAGFGEARAHLLLATALRGQGRHAEGADEAEEALNLYRNAGQRNGRSCRAECTGHVPGGVGRRRREHLILRYSEATSCRMARMAERTSSRYLVAVKFEAGAPEAAAGPLPTVSTSTPKGSASIRNAAVCCAGT